jgi:hypothetical protein
VSTANALYFDFAQFDRAVFQGGQDVGDLLKCEFASLIDRAQFAVLAKVTGITAAGRDSLDAIDVEGSFHRRLLGTVKYRFD